MKETILGNEILPLENFLETIVKQRNLYEDIVRTDTSQHVSDFPQIIYKEIKLWTNKFQKLFLRNLK